MRARLEVLYVLVICPRCDTRLTRSAGQEDAWRRAPTVWHVARLETVLTLECPGCGAELLAGGDAAFPMPRAAWALPPDEEPEEMTR